MDLSKKLHGLLSNPKCQGKSQNEIASEIGIASSVITKIKQGKSTDPSAGTIYAIAKYFEVSADWLLGLSDVPRHTPFGCKELIEGERKLLEEESKKISEKLEEIAADLILKSKELMR